MSDRLRQIVCRVVACGLAAAILAAGAACRKKDRGPEIAYPTQGEAQEKVFAIDSEELVSVWGNIECPEYDGGAMVVTATGPGGAVFDVVEVEQLDEWKIVAPKGATISIGGFWDRDGNGSESGLTAGDLSLINKNDPVRATGDDSAPVRLFCTDNVLFKQEAHIPEPEPKLEDRKVHLPPDPGRILKNSPDELANLTGTIACDDFKGDALVIALDDQGNRFAIGYAGSGERWMLTIPMNRVLFVVGIRDMDGSGFENGAGEGDLYLEFEQNPVFLERNVNPPVELACVAEAPPALLNYMPENAP